jgi:hypothetical protein
MRRDRAARNIEKPQRTIGGVPYADARRNTDRHGRRALAQLERAPPIERPRAGEPGVDVERPAKPSGTARAQGRKGRAGEGLRGPNEDAARRSLALHRDIQAVVHPINKVNVQGPRGLPERGRACGPPAKRMGRRIAFTQIGFRLHDPQGKRTPPETSHEGLSEQEPRGFLGRLGEPGEEALLFGGGDRLAQAWLGGRDSNPDTMVQSHVSYRWTTSQ